VAARYCQGKTGWSLLCKKKGIVTGAEAINALVKPNADAAFYVGKVTVAKYFIKHILPEVESTVKAINSENIYPMEIAVESFAG